MFSVTCLLLLTIVLQPGVLAGRRGPGPGHGSSPDGGEDATPNDGEDTPNDGEDTPDDGEDAPDGGDDMATDDGEDRANDQLYQCQPTTENDGLVYTPNITDDNFKPENIKDTSFKSTQEVMYIFPVPDTSTGNRDCSGNVIAMEYCYIVNNRSQLNATEQSVFVLHSLTNLDQNTLSFTTSFRERVNTTASRKCSTATGDSAVYCCDEETFTELNFTPSKFAFGVEIVKSAVRQLEFSPKPTFTISRFLRGHDQNSNVGPALLLRFRIGML